MSIYDHLNTPALDSLEGELNSLRESRELLELVWEWYGPYGPEEARGMGFLAKGSSRPVINALKSMQMPGELQTRLRRHFRFDDSE